MAPVKRKRANQKSCQRKTQRNQTKQKKPQAKPGRKTRAKQVTKHVKKTNHGRMSSSPAKGCQLTKKAKGVLSSCVEGLCREVSSEANRLRKKINEPTISHEVLLAALEQSMAKENVRHSLTPGAKKTKKKKQSPVDTTQKMPSPTEKQAVPTKMLARSRKQPASPVSHECS